MSDIEPEAAIGTEPHRYFRGQPVYAPSRRMLELLAMPAVSRFFPLRVGTAKWNYLAVVCNACSAHVSADRIHGHLELIAHDVAELEAVAICANCRIASPLLWRFHPNGATSGPEGIAQGQPRGRWITHSAAEQRAGGPGPVAG